MNHTILNCPNRNQIKEKGTEHDMTLVNESLNLKHSLQNSTISTLYSSKEHGGYYNSIAETQRRMHCILKEVFHPNEDINTIGQQWMFDSLLFKVSFIGKNGLEDPAFTIILLWKRNEPSHYLCTEEY